MKKVLIFVCILLIISISSFFYGKHWFQDNSKVNDSTVEIFEGASVKQVAEILELSNTIENADLLYWYIRGKQMYHEFAPWSDQKYEVSFKAGKFNIDEGNFDSLITTLNEIQNIVKEKKSTSVTIPEGETIEGMAKIFTEKGMLNGDTFLKLANEESFYELLRKEYMWLPKFNSEKKYQLEGYLHANTYDFGENALPHDVIKRMIEETDKWYKENKITINKSNYSFSELITLASIVERESKYSEDRPKVAQVFYNRLLNDMRLQSDITAAYANGEHKTFMTYDDVGVESPYNTYYTDGLPIGPINSPSLESFESVLNPSGLSFTAFYFYARPTGETFYSDTLEEHNEVINKYENEWLELDK